MSLWGTISEPSSRAAWNDDQEEEASQSLSWKNKLPVIESIDTFLILEGKQIGTYNDAAAHLRLINTIPEIFLNLFEDEKNSRIICCIKEYDVIKTSEIIELLQDYLTVSSKVIAVLTKSLSDYRVSTLSGSSCVIRSLWTAKLKPDFEYTQLEQPNIISGVSAGAMCLQDHTDKAAIVHVCYLDHPDALDAPELRVLLNALDIQNIIGQESSLINSNLYI